jgi:hypothetical protein
MATDTITSLNTSRLQEDLLFQLARGLSPDQVISVIAFRGNIRSQPQYIRSAAPSLTGGQGVVERLGLLVSLGRCKPFFFLPSLPFS